MLGSLRAFSTLSEVLSNRKEIFKNEGMLLLVGPEGGWEESEEEYLLQNEISPVRMGVHTMRTETASIAGLATAQCVLNKM